MKLELYSTGDGEGKLIKRFLEDNKLPFKEIVTNNINILNKIAHTMLDRKVSLLKIKRNRSVEVIMGFNQIALRQLLRAN